MSIQPPTVNVLLVSHKQVKGVMGPNCLGPPPRPTGGVHSPEVPA